MPWVQVLLPLPKTLSKDKVFFNYRSIEAVMVMLIKKFTAVVVAVLIICNMSVFAVHSEWAEEEISTAVSLGFVPDELQGEYTQNITRKEFAHIAISFLNILKGETKLSNESVFSDTDDSYVTAAYRFGIVNGRGDGTFAPEDSISRQEAARVIANTYRAYLESDALVGDELKFEDTAYIADWAYEDISILCRLGIMRGTGDGMFDPCGLYTREQSIVTFMRLYKIIQSRRQEPSFDGENPQITDFLSVSDGRLISGGREVVLNGVNLGGWLILETWMSPIADSGEEMAYTDVIKVFEKRFGKSRTDEIIEGYEDNFITEQDFDNIEKLGFNCVRIPFWYRNFMTADGKWIQDGFKRLDWAIEQCSKRGLWVILDMHGCPGGQSMNHSTGIKGNNGLYNNEVNLTRMERIWTAIAERYKDIKCIAAYDIMNEPQNNKGYTGPRAWQAESNMAVELTNSVYKRMVEAIRRVDGRHIITLEGIWSMSVLPDPVDCGWNNMMYQLHIYDDTKEDIDLRMGEMLSAREKWGVAVMSGEYNSGTLERYAADLYDKHKISRTKWTYKTFRGVGENWGLYNKACNKIDIKTASFEEIKAALINDVRTDNGFELNVMEYNDIK